MTSDPRLPRGTQLGLLLVCMVFSVIYLAQPTRQMTVASLAQWGSLALRLMGIGRSNSAAWLEPGLEMAARAKPLIDYGDVQFTGCDLAWRGTGSTLELVSYWRFEPQARTPARILEIRFVLPRSGATVPVMQPIDAPTLFTVLPSGFYAAERRGQVWLRVVEAGSERLVEPRESFRPVDAGGWIRVCK